jgi:elongation factor P hydroxylase
MVDLALLEILCCGVDQPQVIRRMVALTDDLVGDIPSDRRPTVEAYRADIARLDPQGLPSRAQRVLRIPDRQGLGGGTVADWSLGEDG